MRNLSQLIDHLKPYSIAYIATYTGLHPNTVQKLRSGNMKNPKLETMQKLEDFLAYEQRL